MVSCCGGGEGTTGGVVSGSDGGVELSFDVRCLGLVVVVLVLLVVVSWW